MIDKLSIQIYENTKFINDFELISKLSAQLTVLGKEDIYIDSDSIVKVLQSALIFSL